MNASQQKAGKGSANMQTKGPSKDNQPLDNPSKSQNKKGNGKIKKDIRKWCDFHKIPWSNIDECRKMKSLAAELKASELDMDYDSNSEIGKQVIDEEPSATITTTQIHPKYLEEMDEGYSLFHSQMWVKGASLHFIVDNGSQKNLI